MSSTCKDCRHWILGGRPNISSGMCAPLDPDTYQPMSIGYRVGECNHPSKTFGETPTERNGFGVADASGYRAVLVTAEDFGCVRHEIT